MAESDHAQHDLPQRDGVEHPASCPQLLRTVAACNQTFTTCHCDICLTAGTPHYGTSRRNTLRTRLYAMTVDTVPFTASHTLCFFLPFSPCGVIADAASDVVERPGPAGFHAVLLVVGLTLASLYAWNVHAGMPAGQLSVWHDILTLTLDSMRIVVPFGNTFFALQGCLQHSAWSYSRR